MFREEAEKLKEVYDNRIAVTQEQMDDMLRSAMPYLRALVEWYDKNQEAAFASENLKCKLKHCEDEEGCDE